MIADDLTGAGDSGVQLTRRGLRAAVLLDVEAEAPRNYNAIVYDTDSRADLPTAAYDKVKTVCLEIVRLGADVIYKKVDSTMRGNIGVELDAVWDVCAPDAIVIAPSFPTNGRVVKDGVLYVHGEPVHQTAIARDPKTPVTVSDVPRLLAGQTARAVELLSLRQLRMGARQAATELRDIVRGGGQYIVADAEHDGDLQLLAAALQHSGLKLVWCGSAGLAAVLPVASAATRTRVELANGEARSEAASDGASEVQQESDNACEIRRTGGGATLVVIGSVNPNTRAQLARLQRDPAISCLELNAAHAVRTATRVAEHTRLYALAEPLLAQGQDVVVYASASPADIEAARREGAALGMAEDEVSNRVSEALGSVAAGLIRACGIRRIVATGGDTARQLCLQLGAAGLEPLTEVEGGVPLSLIYGVKGHPSLSIITKAGGFGDEHALYRYVQFFRGGDIE